VGILADSWDLRLKVGIGDLVRKYRYDNIIFSLILLPATLAERGSSFPGFHRDYQGKTVWTRLDLNSCQ
jgi:hypothetical protein